MALSVRVTQDEADRLKRFVELRNGVDGDITQQSVLRRMVQAIIEDDEGTAAVRAERLPSMSAALPSHAARPRLA